MPAIETARLTKGGRLDGLGLLAVLTAFKNGDFSVRMPLGEDGLRGKIADTLNDILMREERTTHDVARIAITVGREGQISERCAPGDAIGGWADKIQSVNALINDLLQPTAEMARVIGAVAKGDLTQAMPLEIEGRPLKGEFVRTAKVVNGMVMQLNSFASEVTRVAREVVSEGKLGGQAKVKDVAGTWRDLTESVNSMASNLTGQVRNIADVTTSVANGDLSKKITVDVRGEFLQLKDTINTMVDQLRGFASEVTRVAREVGTEGKLGGQAVVPGVAGVWKELTDTVNSMAGNLTAQVRNLAEVTTSIAKGDLTRKITVEVKGEMLALKNTVNTMVDQLGSFASEVTRVASEVGTDGKLGGQGEVRGVSGTWRDLTENVNFMAQNLTVQVRNIAQVTTAVANGDLSKKITVDAKGEILELKNTINTMVDQLNSFASEVTRVAREVGSDGKLGGQADVRGVGGTWKDLTDNVNSMAGNLTSQVRNIADVTTAVANGDLARKITVDAKGEILELKNTINTMVDRLNSFSAEVTRVAREVGTEGILGGQGEVAGVAGTWKDLTDSVNGMASNLTNQVRNIADVTTAVARGDLTRKITVDAKGEILELKNTINTMVEQLSSFASEVTRVAREVGSDGILGGQGEVAGVAGTWKDLTDSVNGMASNLTNQVRNIADVTTAVAKGDLTRKITVDAKGEILELKNTINTMVDRLNSFAAEVTRVAREVGSEGTLGGQADVKGVGGTWRDLTDSVNRMASNLTGQVRNIADVTTAVANGDLARKITVDAKGEILELKNTINTMVDQLNSFASEVTRVAREVGSEGKLGGQAEVKGMAGTWKDLTDNVNGMASNLTNQVRNIAHVTTAVANGDLTRTITVDAKGEILELKSTVNLMVDRLNSFAAEVTRVAREVGTEGKLGGLARVPDVAGTWKDLTDNVNGMANNLTGQVRNIADVTTAVARGDLTRKITVDARGEILELKNTINTMVDQLNSFAAEVTRVGREVGTEGKLGGQAQVVGVGGTWKDLTNNVNLMAANLTSQVRNIANVTTAVANGDLTRKITVDARGEILELKDTINTMVDQLNSFASEVTRVAREVGTEGKLGGQAQVRGVSGTWKDLTDNVNFMAANLTNQVRGIARVVTAVATGNLKLKLTVEAKGEIASLADTINSMTDTLGLFADQVTSVAREVGVEGRLGGQANVPGAAGTWKDLTDNVNRLAANLTTQVRAIAEVSTAVAKGDFSRSIAVEASGEVALLKDNVNEMIRNLKGTTRKNTEQDWLKTNLTNFTRKLQGQRDLKAVCTMTLSDLAPLVNAQHGVFYINEMQRGDEPSLRLLASYAYRERKNLADRFSPGEGIVGQCLLEKQHILMSNVPADYVQISSGLGEGTPLNIVALPVIFENETKAVIELASFERFSDTHLAFLDQLMEGLAIVINTIEANTRTEELLKQSQSLTQELQSQQSELTVTNQRLEQQAKSLQSSEEMLKRQQEELQQTNAELEEKAKLLAEQKTEVERKNVEVGQARDALQTNAEELALTSKYKSEFLANMSHELRTPLNSLLILSQMLSENSDGNLSEKQVEYARTIQGSGNDLLELINEILDLSKIESGTTAVDISEVCFGDVKASVDRAFEHVAAAKKLRFTVTLAPDLPPCMHSDLKRLEQVLKNLLSNAFKFTETGEVGLTIHPADSGWSAAHPGLINADRAIAFDVHDTGIGVPTDKQRVIFEAFQQADGTTARKYGGTGLGLSISREIARLLGGTLQVVSAPGQGSTFTCYLPLNYQPEAPSARSGGGPARGRLGAERDAAAIALDGERDTPNPLNDDRADLQPGDDRLLIVDEDEDSARTLMVSAREQGFKVITAATAAAALAEARRYVPTAITLDLRLPDRDGWLVLDRLKGDPSLRHIPVEIISEMDDEQRGRTLGALAFLRQPATKASLDAALTALKVFARRGVRKLLVVHSDPNGRKAIVELMGDGDVEVTAAGTAAEAMTALESTSYDCLVLDLKLSDMSGTELLSRLNAAAAHPTPPVIIYTGKALTSEELAELRSVSKTVVITNVSSPERLLDETALLLHRVHANLPIHQRTMIAQARQTDSVLAGKRVLVVDDDIRNVFAMGSALERCRANVTYAESGAQALDALENTPDIDVVLMDIMMPDMDGYETIRRIRRLPQCGTVPIIAVTAKAMKGDRAECLRAGANDYLSKPVDLEQLQSLLRVGLYEPGPS